MIRTGGGPAAVGRAEASGTDGDSTTPFTADELIAATEPGSADPARTDRQPSLTRTSDRRSLDIGFCGRVTDPAGDRRRRRRMLGAARIAARKASVQIIPEVEILDWD